MSCEFAPCFEVENEEDVISERNVDVVAENISASQLYESISSASNWRYSFSFFRFRSDI
jgi:hypothetical protein